MGRIMMQNDKDYSELIDLANRVARINCCCGGHCCTTWWI